MPFEMSEWLERIADSRCEGCGAEHGCLHEWNDFGQDFGQIWHDANIVRKRISGGCAVRGQYVSKVAWAEPTAAGGLGETLNNERRTGHDGRSA